MTSPSRRKHPTTVRKSRVQTILRNRLAACLAVGLIGSLISSTSETQGQEPKWSPHPYQQPVTQAKAASQFTTSGKQGKVATPDSDPEIAPVQRWRKTEAISRQAKTQQALKPMTSIASADHRETNPIAAAEPVRFDNKPSSNRKTVVAAKWSAQEDPNQEAMVPLEPVRLKPPTSEKQSLIYQDSDPKPSSPAIAEPIPTDPPAIPNPFPKPILPGESPSDRVAPPNSLIDPLDLPPIPPREVQRSTTNCGAARDFIENLDIKRIRVDSSPMFVEGYPSKDRINTNTKENFIAEAPVRAWYSIAGEEIARGKLVDLVFDSVVIEKQDGSKMTYLLRRLSDQDQVYVSEAWGVPVTCSLGDQGVAERMFADSVLTWKASGTCHKPLYFEDVQLERYGHEWGPVVQPALSTVRFFGDLAFLPYKMGIHPPNECQYPLGYYRPGECAPWTRGPVPISLRGAMSQAAFVTGTAWALP
jgi:hypothetical protein